MGLLIPVNALLVCQRYHRVLHHLNIDKNKAWMSQSKFHSHIAYKILITKSYIISVPVY